MFAKASGQSAILHLSLHPLFCALLLLGLGQGAKEQWLKEQEKKQCCGVEEHPPSKTNINVTGN